MAKKEKREKGGSKKLESFENKRSFFGKIKRIFGYFFKRFF